ncbi:MAG: hypothetical protein KDB52_04210 [Solirubrobacterales bacterium]|nr:hypothetical protein [Solirubrobacterales bacterium]
MTFRRQFRLVLAIGFAALFAGLAVQPAQANSTRVSISDFKWSKEPTVNLGESVTWDWIGPDLQHSVTGQAPNATQWDSAPGIPSPRQNLGDSFKVTFDQPGHYLFVCKLHPQAVRGTVTVTNLPGDPNSDPGPQDPLKFDLEPPQVEAVGLSNTVIGYKGNGTMLNLEVSEKGTASIDYFRLVKQGRGKKTKTVRRFAGYHERPIHIGINAVRFANRTSTFKPQAGKYVAIVRVDDENTNASPDFTLPFEIKAKKKKKK